MTDANVRLSKLENALEEIAAAGDAARLQLHLLSMQARERTGEFGTSIESLEQKIDRGIEQAMHTAASKTRELTSTVREFLGKSPAQTRLQVKTVMTDVVRSCAPSDPLSVAAKIMWDHDCGAVPVVQADGRLCGIITDRDLCMASYTQGRPLEALRVVDIMSRPVHTCGPEDTLDRAAAIMAEGQIRRLPVVDGEGRPLGIVSISDIALGAAALGQREGQAMVFQLLRAISKPRRSDRGIATAAQ
jgi:CBS-domain-containing membrane protein